MGLCWHIARDGQTRWHNGETGGYHSMVLVNREQQLGVVVLANTADGGVDALAEDLMRMLAGSKVSPRDFKKPAKVDAQVVQRYVGTFEIVPGFALEIVADENRLTVQATNQPAFRLFPRTDTEWFLRVVEATITFRVDEAGVCNELDLFQGGVHNTAKRIPKR